jgi:tRNA threonylcarbamoyladenosine biosynthesis protein TsaE
MRLEVESGSAADTLRIGEALGRLLEEGDVLGLSGDLGAGKTELVRGLARGLDIDPDVIYSPSFTLVAEHEGRLRLHHIDLFRLGEPVSLLEEEEIGLTDYLSPSGVTAVEWHRKLPARTGAWTLEVEIAVGDGDRRLLQLEGDGPRAVAILEGLGRSCR